ncbi:Protein kinase alk2 [Cytospora paraplurivora]|uniref:Protein kinase alk2 n=1 Tax=Cytospora paraplurivora TaxID=2898453 RepID=A0AAN9UNA9_9PEZI
MSAGLVLLLVLISRKVIDAVARRRISAENGCKPIHNWYRHRDPLGLDFVFAQVKAFREKRLLDQINDNHVALGTTFAGRAFTQPFIATIDPENIKTVLAARFKDYAIGAVRAPRLGRLLGRGIFVTDGQEWSHSRSMLRPNFAKDQVADLVMVERHIGHLIAAVVPGTTVDLQELISRFTLDSSTEFLFGHSTYSQLGGEFATREFNHNLNFSFKEVALELRMGALATFRSPTEKRRRDKAYEVCRLYVAGFVDKAIAMRSNVPGNDKNDSRTYFLKELAQSSHDRERITDALLNLLFAGRDTTASLLSSLFLVLAHRPDIWEKLRSEVAPLGGQSPTYAQLRDLKYARNCLQESESQT